jgi:hypothetical protein
MGSRAAVPSQHPDLVTRVRGAIPTGRAVREVRMFGGISFMLDERMLVAARRGGDLLVRIDPDMHDDLLLRPGAHPALMGTERPMGPGWISVGPDGTGTDSDLTEWVAVALEVHGRSAVAKAPDADR